MVALAASSVVVVRFPFSDLSNSKLRPAVVLAGVGLWTVFDPGGANVTLVLLLSLVLMGCASTEDADTLAADTGEPLPDELLHGLNVAPFQGHRHRLDRHGRVR